MIAFKMSLSLPLSLTYAVPKKHKHDASVRDPLDSVNFGQTGDLSKLSRFDKRCYFSSAWHDIYVKCKETHKDIYK